MDDSALAKPQTVAQCHEVIDALMGLVAQTQRLVAEQQGQIAWLQERVELDSKTSSKPPSSDGPGSGNRAQRRASGRKRGAERPCGQLPGAARRAAGRPDHRLPTVGGVRVRW